MEFKLESDKIVLVVGTGTSEYSEVIPDHLFLLTLNLSFPIEMILSHFLNDQQSRMKTKDATAQFLKISLYANIIHMQIGRKSPQKFERKKEKYKLICTSCLYWPALENTVKVLYK